MAPHPYISGAVNITKIVGLLRKNFPAVVTSDTVKKFGLASNNESYVINALQFIGIINEDGKRTDRGRDIFTKHNDEEFREAFDALVREAYEDLFELRGDDAWTLKREDLIGYFRTTDKTSEVVGTRQAAVFQALAALAGHDVLNAGVRNKADSKPQRASARGSKGKPSEQRGKPSEIKVVEPPKIHGRPSREMALTVRIEINLPTDGTRDTYDSIFRSIRANLLDV